MRIRRRQGEDEEQNGRGGRSVYEDRPAPEPEERSGSRDRRAGYRGSLGSNARAERISSTTATAKTATPNKVSAISASTAPILGIGAPEPTLLRLVTPRRSPRRKGASPYTGQPARPLGGTGG
jgi:hypothetical protein